MIIFIHGIMGSPDQFEKLIFIAKSHGYSVSAILLPGHGGTTNDFNKSGWYAWRTYVQEHIERMSKNYANIILVGHSMGALLAFDSYGYYSNSIEGIVSVSAPLSVLIKPRIIKSSWAVALGRVNEHDLWTKAAFDSCSVERTSVWAYVRSIPRFFDLFKLMYSIRKKLEQIEIPALLVHSVDDEIANIRSMKTLEKKLRQAETLKLHHSGHYYYTKQDTEIMARKFIQFLSKLKI